MPAVSASAPGKLILFGEHAVVYGKPAIAVPFNAVHARAAVFATPLAPAGQVRIEAQAIGMDHALAELPPDHPFAIAVAGVLEALTLDRLPACHIRISSTIPMAAGMGSSAAVSIALIRSVSTFLGHPLKDEVVNQIAFRVEQKLHGNPSGVDNTVICYNRPVYFIRQKPLQFLRVRQKLDLLVADSGIAAETGPMVQAVHQRFQTNPDEYEACFNQIAAIVARARACLETADCSALGTLMNENHFLLKKIGVSTPVLDELVETALRAGASGAKLTGGGGGGNIIALVPDNRVEQVTTDLLTAGAQKTWLAALDPTVEVEV